MQLQNLKLLAKEKRHYQNYQDISLKTYSKYAYLYTANEPKPKLMVMDTFSGNMYKKLLEKRIIHRPITANTTDPNLILNRFRDGQGIYYTSNTDIIIPNSY